MALPTPTFRSSNLVAPDLSGAIRGVGQLSQAFAGLEDKAMDEYNILAKEQQAARDEAYRQEILGFKQRAEERANQERQAKQDFYKILQKGPQQIGGTITDAMQTPEYQAKIDAMSLTPEEQEAHRTGQYTDFNQAAQIERKLEEQGAFGKALTDSYKPQYETQSEMVTRAMQSLGGYIPDIAYDEMKAAKAADLVASQKKQESLQKLMDAANKSALSYTEKAKKFATTKAGGGTGTSKTGVGGSAGKYDYNKYLGEQTKALNTWAPFESFIGDIGQAQDAAAKLQKDQVPVKYFEQAMGLYSEPGFFADANIPESVTTDMIVSKAKELQGQAKSGKYGKNATEYTNFLEAQAKAQTDKATKYGNQLSTLLAGKTAGRELPSQQAADEFFGNARNRAARFDRRIVEDNQGNKLLYDTATEAAEAKADFKEEKDLLTDVVKKRKKNGDSLKTGFEDLSNEDIKTLFADLDPKEDADVLGDLRREVINRGNPELAISTNVIQSGSDIKVDPKVLAAMEAQDKGLVDQSLMFLPAAKSAGTIYKGVKNSSNFWKGLKPDPKLLQQTFGKSPLAKVLNASGKSPVSKKALIDKATILRNKKTLSMPEAEELQALQKLIKAAK